MEWYHARHLLPPQLPSALYGHPTLANHHHHHHTTTTAASSNHTTTEGGRSEEGGGGGEEGGGGGGGGLEVGVVAKVVYLVVLSVVIILGNILVIASVAKVRDMHRTTNYFLVSLATADLMVGVFTVPLFILWLLDHQLYSHTTSCNLVLLTCFFVMAASQLNVVVVTVERYTAVCHPFLHRRLLASRPELVTVTIALVWVVSLASAALSSQAIDSGNSACSYYDHFHHAFLLAVVVVGVFLPFAVIVALNVRMLVKVRSSRLFKRDMGQSPPPPMSSSSSARPLRRGSSGARVVSKATTMVMTVCCLFLLAWTPFFVVILCHSFCPSCRLRQALDLILLFAFANSAWNPVVYALCNLMFRRAYRQVLTLRRCWAQVSVTLGGEAVRKGSGSSLPRLGSTGGSL